MLEWPYRQLIALVLEDFEPHDRAQLRLRAGEQIIIIGKEGYRDGWWKAKSKHGVSCVVKVVCCFSKAQCGFRLVIFRNIASEKNRKFYMM